MKTGIKCAVLVAVVMIIVAGCAPTNVQQQSMNLTQLSRPDAILVYDFAVSPDEVKLDTGLSAELMQKYEQYTGEARRFVMADRGTDIVPDDLDR